MNHAYRSTFGTHILELNDELRMQLRDEAEEALNGDGTCNLENMDSCFGAESCAFGQNPQMTLHDLRGPAFVAVTDVGEDNIAPLETPRFVGCVSLGPPPSWACMKMGTPRNCNIVYNFCITKAYRGQGIGRMLMNKCTNCKNLDDIFLLISKGSPDMNHELQNVFDQRVLRLLATYEKMHFKKFAECDVAILMQKL